jgi:hypothetical protein
MFLALYRLFCFVFIPFEEAYKYKVHRIIEKRASLYSVYSSL